MGFPHGSDSKKFLPAMQETQVQSLGWEDPWSREWLPSPASLENSMDSGVWQATVHEVTKCLAGLSN